MTSSGRSSGFDLDGFRARLRDEVERRGGQKQVSELLGMHRQDLNRLINSDCVPRLDRAAHIAATLDLGLDWLVMGRSDSPGVGVVREARALEASLSRAVAELDRSQELGRGLLESMGKSGVA